MKKIYALTLLVIVAFLVRGLVFFNYLNLDNRYSQVDTTTYELLAQQLAKTNTFTTPDGEPNGYRLPGYPLFLATVFKIAGINHQAALWVQIFLASFIPLLVFFLAQVLFPARPLIAWSAAIITVFHLGYVLYAGFMMSETLFVLLFLLFLIPFFHVVLRAQHRDSCVPARLSSCTDPRPLDNLSLASNPLAKSREFVLFYGELIEPEAMYDCYVRRSGDTQGFEIFFAGIMLGLASLVRPVGHYFIALAMVLLFFAGTSRLKQLSECVVFGFGWLLIVGGWLIRNWFIFGYVFFHSLPGGHFLYLSAARVLAAEKNISYQAARVELRQTMHKRLTAAAEEKGAKLNEYETCRIHEKLALEVFKSAPLTSFKTWALDMFRASASLYSAELLYLESNRADVEYFKTHRPITDLFMRYLQPNTDLCWLKILIRSEIFFHLFLLIGVLIFCFQALFSRKHRQIKIFFITMPIIAFFIAISLAGGYARMRLPIEFLLIILACSAIPMLYKNNNAVFKGSLNK